MYPGYDWVATPPPTAKAPEPPLRLPYLGPPRYRTPPRWGFPALAWRWPTAIAGAAEEGASPVERVRGRARLAASALWLLAAVAVIAAGAEVWRYALLVQSRTGALSRTVVQWSDSLVTTGAVLSFAAGLLSLATVLWWLHAARRAATELAGYHPARDDWQLVPGILIPGINLIVPGAVLAELEHAILRRPADERPNPSPLLKAWWITWAASGLLFTATLLWRLNTSAQSQADGVLLTAFLDLTAAATAVLTIRLVDRLSLLLAPINPSTVRRLRVVRIDTTGDPVRTSRPTTAAR
ncbi:DUF4328 domain-containing protein [Actinokineospora diospyrosa]|uniref:DUF4328 domain-containing protein n=1 Tax=Actinokineospora diospyrosa TaxID=103728 RepID=A0ABT1ICW7_9PSEU|nr:DUF4328 domain-containing protein [Actinokineospora diospyrosa]MCP2270480.1 protein of unknown function (DUF4328) [Actinokineospora diospyrosa]